MRKSAIDKRIDSRQMGDQGAMGDAAEVTDVDWIRCAVARIMTHTDPLDVDIADTVEAIIREEHAKRSPWTSEMPTCEGEYEIRCMESDGKPDRVVVYYRHFRNEKYLAINDKLNCAMMGHG